MIYLFYSFGCFFSSSLFTKLLAKRLISPTTILTTTNHFPFNAIFIQFLQLPWDPLHFPFFFTSHPIHKLHQTHHSMQETKQGDARIYIVSTIFFLSICTGGAFLCLYMLQPKAESASWYPVVGIVLIGIPWIFWITTYLYRCFEDCVCGSNGGNLSRELSSLTKKQSCAADGHVGNSMDSLENEGSPLGSPDGDHFCFGNIVDNHGGESPRKGARPL
ncbi:hypothetical protein ES319_A11G240000v1 [Gossypium barbadense]|uniref:Uncharacterized protein n=2 Tax=Gossypium barbadense TaxID=3634 RepID=A0A5J5TRV1_GOSBA|nr:hypothetical protein ES319_A11G240000v1 [Gossypium barbadense]